MAAYRRVASVLLSQIALGAGFHSKIAPNRLKPTKNRRKPSIQRPEDHSARMADIPEVVSSDPQEMLAVGRRHLAVKDYNSAVTVLGKACELLSQKFGQQADECGEAYFWYGKSLLGLAREESGVLGDGLATNEANDENPDEEDDNDEEEANNEETDKPESENKTEIEDKIEDKVQNDSENSDKKDVEMESSNQEPVAGSSGAGPSTSDGEAIEDEEEDVENLQIAWEVFELARDVFLKRDKRGMKELADVYVHLGEVSLESETYDKAVSDMTKGLNLYKELYRSDDRRIAETHYQIGLAHSLSNGFDDAITNFKSAAEILETRIKNLQAPDALTEDSDVRNSLNVNPFYSIEGEIKELTELLPEIREKIQDMIDYKAEAVRSLKETLGLGTSNGKASTSNGTSSSKPEEEKKASDISYLIKRKRKPEDEASADNPPKKSAN